MDCRALRMLREGCNVRLETIRETAKEYSVSVGEADLRRLKRQFSSLKNTFLHYEVKDEFIAALADGLPNGTEDIQLAQFEEEAERNISLLREWKGRNAEKQEEILNLIGEVEHAMKNASAAGDATAAVMAQLEEEIQAFQIEHGDASDEIPEGMTNEECQLAITEEAKRAGELESMLVGSLGDVARLEGELAKEQEHLDMARSVLADLRSKQKENESHAHNTSSIQKHSASAAWAVEALEVLQALSGVTNAMLQKDCILKFKLQTMFPRSPMLESEALHDCVSTVHDVELEISESQGTVNGGRMLPADVDIDPVLWHLRHTKRTATIECVTSELRSMIAGLYHRRSMVEEAKGLYFDVSVDREAKEVMAECIVHGGRLHVKTRVTSSWPEGDDSIRVEDVIGESRLTEPANSSKGVAYPSFALAFEAVIRLVNSAQRV